MHQRFLFLIAICLSAATWLAAQVPSSAGGTGNLTAAQRASQSLTDSDIYCAGFYTHRTVEPGLSVLGGEEGGLKNEFGDRDMIYLSRGKGSIGEPNTEYMIVRPVQDLNPTESFPKQRMMLKRMGTLYSEIARIRVLVVHERSTTAEIVSACEPVLVGDVAIPLTARSAPRLKSNFTDRYAPSSGKATGVIAAIKESAQLGGPGHVVYFNLGKKQGADPGGYLRIFRRYLSSSQDMTQKSTENFSTTVMGVSIGRKLTMEEKNSLPRTVLGEVLILSAEDDTATGIIIHSFQDVYPGDELEIE